MQASFDDVLVARSADRRPARFDEGLARVFAVGFLLKWWRARGTLRRSWLGRWGRRWELWLWLAVGAWLRLADLRHTMFLDDQVFLLRVGQAAFQDGGLPITGIRSSVGTLNAPFSIYLYLPFAALGSPLAAAWMIALANVLALALTYVLVDRAFGRLVAGFTLALYATSAYAVFYSSYFWQQTAVAPFLLGYLLTLYAGVVQQRQRWLLPHLLLLGVLSQLHPITVYLIPTTLVGLALLWPRIPWRSLVLGLLGIGLLYVPTLIWGLVSDWADLRLLQHNLFALPAHNDLQGLGVLLLALGFEGSLPFGMSASWLGWLLDGAFVLALVWLVWQVGAPLVRALRAKKGGDGIEALWRLREDARWRAEVLLFAWQVVPLLLMIHWTHGYCTCYMVVFFPAPLMIIGLALAWVFERAGLLVFVGRVLEWLKTCYQARPTGSLQGISQGREGGLQAMSQGRLWRGGVLSGLVLLLVLQVFSSSHPTIAYRGLDTEEASLRAGQREARAIGATQTILASSLFLYGAFAYLAEHEFGTVAVRSAESCLALPSVGELPAVVVTAFDQEGSRADEVLGALPAATLLGALPVRDQPPDHLYRVDGPDLRLAHEEVMAQPVLADQHLALEGMAVLPGPQRLVVLRWRVVQAYQEPRGPGAEPLSLLFGLQPLIGSGAGSGTGAVARCMPGQLEAGETLLVWFDFPGTAAGTAVASQGGLTLANLSVHLVVSRRVEPVVGPLRFVTGATSTTVSPSLPLLCLPGQPTYASCPLALPASSLGTR